MESGIGVAQDDQQASTAVSSLRTNWLRLHPLRVGRCAPGRSPERLAEQTALPAMKSLLRSGPGGVG